MNNEPEVFDIPTLGYVDWRETMEKVIEFGIKNWKIQGSIKEPMVFNFPPYVKKTSQRTTFIAQFNNRFKLHGMQVDATWDRMNGKVKVTFID